MASEWVASVNRAMFEQGYELFLSHAPPELSIPLVWKGSTGELFYGFVQGWDYHGIEPWCVCLMTRSHFGQVQLWATRTEWLEGEYEFS